jgi:(p)ppGpp synthase/HD superfamily hydrolase
LTVPPPFVVGKPLTTAAWEWAEARHRDQVRAFDQAPFILHPLEVAALLSGRSYDDEVIAAGLLHDVIEDTTTDLEEIEDRFGPEVARLVGQMTEDPEIESYERRKAEHRDRVARDRNVAAIYAADKLAGARSMREDPGSVAEPRLQHYLSSFDKLGRLYPDLPFLPELRGELRRLEQERETGGDG